jgi:hypothetical protein
MPQRVRHDCDHKERSQLPGSSVWMLKAFYSDHVYKICTWFGWVGYPLFIHGETHLLEVICQMHGTVKIHPSSLTYSKSRVSLSFLIVNFATGALTVLDGGHTPCCSTLSRICLWRCWLPTELCEGFISQYSKTIIRRPNHGHVGANGSWYVCFCQEWLWDWRPTVRKVGVHSA